MPDMPIVLVSLVSIHGVMGRVDPTFLCGGLTLISCYVTACCWDEDQSSCWWLGHPAGLVAGVYITHISSGPLLYERILHQPSALLTMQHRCSGDGTGCCPVRVH